MVGSDSVTNDYYYYYSHGRAKELARETAAKSKAKSAANGSGGNGTNVSHRDEAMVKPTAAPEPSDG
jgi:hypothetical protein